MNRKRALRSRGYVGIVTGIVALSALFGLTGLIEYDEFAAPVALDDGRGGSRTLASITAESEVVVAVLIGDSVSCISCTVGLAKLCDAAEEWTDAGVTSLIVGDSSGGSDAVFWAWHRTRDPCFTAYFDSAMATREEYGLPNTGPMVIGFRAGRLTFALPMRDTFWIRFPQADDYLRYLVQGSGADAFGEAIRD